MHSSDVFQSVSSVPWHAATCRDSNRCCCCCHETVPHDTRHDMMYVCGSVAAVLLSRHCTAVMTALNSHTAPGRCARLTILGSQAQVAGLSLAVDVICCSRSTSWASRMRDSGLADEVNTNLDDLRKEAVKKRPVAVAGGGSASWHCS